MILMFIYLLNGFTGLNFFPDFFFLGNNFTSFDATNVLGVQIIIVRQLM